MLLNMAQEHRQLNGLFQEAHGAVLYCFHRLGNVTMRRDNDHRPGAIQRRHLLEELHAIHSRQNQIQRHEIWIFLFSDAQRLVGTSGSGNLVSLVREYIFEDSDGLLFVVNHKDVRCALLPHVLSPCFTLGTRGVPPVPSYLPRPCSAG